MIGKIVFIGNYGYFNHASLLLLTLFQTMIFLGKGILKSFNFSQVIGLHLGRFKLTVNSEVHRLIFIESLIFRCQMITIL
jgi:hypothetical protein